MYKSDKILITVALSGETSRSQSKYIPYTPEEIALSAIEAGAAGASIAHIHVRDSNGNPSSDPEIYKKVVKLIKKESDIIINCTTSGPSYDEKRRVLEINPELATLNCGSANLDGKLMLNTQSELEKMSTEMINRNIKPEIMIHSQGFIDNAKKLIDKGKIKPPYYFNLFFASGGMIPSLNTLSYLVGNLPPNSIWTATGSGSNAFTMAISSIIYGGTARIGLEDCIYISEGNLAKSNAQLVEKLVKIARELGKDIMTPNETREIMKTP